MRRLLIIPLLFILLLGCAGKTAGSQPADSSEAGMDGTLRGISLSPLSSQGKDFTDFLEKTDQTGDIVMWAGDWAELSDGAPQVVEGLSAQYGYIPLIEVTYYSQGEGKLIRPFDTQAREEYKSDAIAFAEKYKPEYLGMGIEVNIMHEKSPEDYAEFAGFYNEMYDAVKEKSPGTKVFTVFQLERMKGYGFWSDGVADLNETQWGLMDDFKSDIAAFSTYPGLVFKDPSEIPADYYDEIRSHTSKPIAFTEIGWHSAASPPGWESSEAEQAGFIDRFFELTQDIDMEAAIWSFMYDPDTIEPFDSMGLRRRDGSAKMAWDEWVNGGR